MFEVVYVRISWYLLVYSSIYKYIQVYTQCIQVYTSIYFVEVADVQNLVGIVPLIPLFLAGNSNPATIPHMFNKSKDSGFPYGCADAAPTD